MKKVQTDLNEGFEWYEERLKGLGYEFLNAIEKTITEIVAHPESFGRALLLHTIAFSSEVTTQLVDRNGARAKEWKFSPSLKQNTYRLNVSNLAQGLYLVRITDDKGNTQTEKIVIGR